MAVSIAQQPIKYNLVYAPQVWTLTGLAPAEDAYVLQVESYDETTGTSTSIAQVRQPANPADNAHFDVQKILQAQMDIKFTETTQEATTTDGTTFSYRVRYGTVTDGAVAFDGLSSVKYAFNGYQDWRDISWDNEDYIPEPFQFPCETGGFATSFAAAPYEYLHNNPSTRIKLRSSSYHTLSFFNRIGNYDNGTNWDFNEQPYAVRIRYYDISDGLIATSIYALSETTGLGPRPTFDSTTVGQYEPQEWIGTIGAGPQNLKDGGYWPASGNAIWSQIQQVWGGYNQIWNLATSSAIVHYYVVDVMSINGCKVALDGMPADDSATTLSQYVDQVIYTETFELEDPCTPFEPITVSFLNQYGVKDYFTFDRRNTWTQSINRNNYDQMLGSWSAATFSIDQTGRGRRTFSTAIQTNMTMSSYWMGDEESAWLEELFTSPHIQVYYDGQWNPAVITSNSYEQKTASRNGLFQHTLNIQFANAKTVQRG